MVTEYRIIKTGNTTHPYSLERKLKTKWKELGKFYFKDAARWDAEFRFTRQTATEMILTDETIPEFRLVNGMVSLAG